MNYFSAEYFYFEYIDEYWKNVISIIWQYINHLL